MRRDPFRRVRSRRRAHQRAAVDTAPAAAATVAGAAMIEAAGWRWQDKAAGGGLMSDDHPQRRVCGFNDCRYDGLSDLLLRAQGASVLDVGCNRGHVGYEFYRNGARLVHGCDIDGQSIAIARGWFSELAELESKFVVLDLQKQGAIAAAFGDAAYDIVLFVGVYHKLVRVMSPALLSWLMNDLGWRASRYFAWNGYPEHIAANLPACAISDVCTREGSRRFGDARSDQAATWSP